MDVGAATLAPSVAVPRTEPTSPLRGSGVIGALPLSREAGEVSAGASQTTEGTRATAAARAKVDKTARDFEASFLSVMLGQMFSGLETSAPFGGGQGEQMYKSFLTDAFSRSLADRGGVGVSKAVATELLKLQGMTP